MPLTPMRALVLEAYFSLFQRVPAETIGPAEVRTWVRETKKGQKLRIPSPPLVRETLNQHGLTHRARGRPRNDSRLYRGEESDASPFPTANDEPRRDR
jgi:hypothetical protein